MIHSILKLLLVIVSGAFVVFAQAPPQVAPHSIEVTGEAELTAQPDQFTFRIVLTERYDKKNKITLDEQERDLRNALAQAGIDVQKDLTVSDLSARLDQIRRRRQPDALGTREYRLRVTGIGQITAVQRAAEAVTAAEIDLVEATSSRMPELERQAREEAIRAARDKARSMLSAIGEKIGSPLRIEEQPESHIIPLRSRLVENEAVMGRYAAPQPSPEPPLPATEIKIKSLVRASFEIQTP